jgi:hypothetical protein
MSTKQVPWIDTEIREVVKNGHFVWESFDVVRFRTVPADYTPADDIEIEWEDDVPVVKSGPTYPEFADFGE